jgi:peptidyl-prolyl cis-trans isomerase SurA
MISSRHLCCCEAEARLAVSPRDPLLAGPAVPWKEESGGRMTEDDIDQRAKFNKLASHKDWPRRQIIHELIDDRLKFLSDHHYGTEPTNKDIDAQYAEIAKRMNLSAEELTQTLPPGRRRQFRRVG